MLSRAATLVSSGKEGQIVDLAIETNRSLGHLQSELDLCKNHLRKVGVEKATFLEATSVEIQGLLGKAQVILVGPQMRIRSGVDLLATEKSFPPDVFANLFVKKTVVELAPDFKERLQELPFHQQRAISNLVEAFRPTSRVNLSR